MDTALFEAQPMTDQEQQILRMQEQIDRLQKQTESFQLLQEQHAMALTELQVKEEFNYTLFKYSPAVMVVVDKKGRVVRSNAAKLHSGDRLPDIGAEMYKDYASHHSIDMHGELMRCIRNNISKSFPKMKYKDRYMTITIAPFPQGAIIATQDITDQIKAEEDRLTLIGELRKALSEVETLRGLLPMCSSCKKIRNDQGYWQTVEEYFAKNGHIDFSHTVCPDCVKTLYPEFWAKQQQQRPEGNQP